MRWGASESAKILILSWLVVCLACKSTSIQAPPVPRLNELNCSDVEFTESASASAPLNGVSKLELHRRGLRARFLAEEFRDIAVARRHERDAYKKSFEKEREYRKEAEKRPTWWMLVGVGGGAMALGVLLGFMFVGR